MPKKKPPPTGFAQRLKELRAKAGLTQVEVAAKAHVALSYLSKLESGGAAPGIDLVDRLAAAQFDARMF